MSHSDTEECLMAIAAALEAEDSVNVDNGSCCENRGNQIIVEPNSKIRYRNSKIQQEVLDAMFKHFLSIEKIPKMGPNMKSLDTVGVIIRRFTNPPDQERSYIKWVLSDLEDNSVPCILTDDAMEAHSQLKPGTVVSVMGTIWMTSEKLRAKNGKQVQILGVSADYGICAGHKKNGERCTNAVNKSKSEFCTWHLSQGHKRLAMGARPECTDTVLGIKSKAPSSSGQRSGKENLSRATNTPAFLTKSKPKSLAQIDQEASAHGKVRLGSRGAKLVGSFVSQEREAKRQAKVKQKEALLYQNTDQTDTRPPLPKVPRLSRPLS